MDPITQRYGQVYILDVPTLLPISQLSKYLRSLTRYHVRILLFLFLLLILTLLLILILNLILIFLLLTVKEKRVALYTLHNFSSYSHLFTQYRAFVFSIDSHPMFKFVSDVMSNPGRQAMTKDELHALEQNGT